MFAHTIDPVERRIRLTGPLDLALTLAPLRHGGGDPTIRIAAGEVLRATRTPEGPVTMHLRAVAGEITVRAWGAGAPWALETAPKLVGALDDPGAFQPRHPVVHELCRRLRGLRIPRTETVLHELVPLVLEQKVTAVQAKRSYRALALRLGEEAPGPAGRLGLLLPPDPVRVAALPSYAFHPLNVERKRAETLRRACASASRLQEAAAMALPDARRRLMVLPGLGPWTAAGVALVALGDTDAVPVGDYHLPHMVSWALAGEPRGDDARMLELLEPYRGQRGRVVRLVAAGGARPARVAPRARLHQIAAI